jgi:hypothetical protein
MKLCQDIDKTGFFFGDSEVTDQFLKRKNSYQSLKEDTVL